MRTPSPLRERVGVRGLPAKLKLYEGVPTSGNYAPVQTTVLRARELRRDSTPAIEYDTRLTAVLNGLGYRVLRFWNNEVLEQLDAVLDLIHIKLLEQDTPRPNPLPEGEGTH